MFKEPQFSLFDLIFSFCDTLDMINPLLVNHHRQTAYITYRIADEIGLPYKEKNDLVLAAALHDIGALSLIERIDLRQFDLDTYQQHAEIGFRMLDSHKDLADVAVLVKFHHVPWNWGSGTEHDEQYVPIGSHIIHLADRISVLIDPRRNIMTQAMGICERITHGSGEHFKKEIVEIFLEMACKEYFWLDLTSPERATYPNSPMDTETIDTGGLLEYARLFSKVVDFRNPFTVSHSAGVAVTAAELARFARFSGRECQMMKIAGYLHDLGKLAIPEEIIGSVSKLSKEDFDYMKCHSYYTYHALEKVDGLELINTWAAFHHERLDGNGYPFHLSEKDLSLGTRIIAVADVCSAIVEDRPHRKGMPSKRTSQVMQTMAENSELDANLVLILLANYQEINSKRIEIQDRASSEYERVVGGTENAGKASVN